MNPPSPLHRQARPGQLDVSAGPLCTRVAVLSVLELASRDARRRPLCLPDEPPTDSPELKELLEQARRHVHEERCPTCLRWYRNATHAYYDTLRQQLLPVERVPIRLLGSDARPEYRLDPERAGHEPGKGLLAVKASLLWQGEPGSWSCRLRFQPGEEGSHLDLSAFEGSVVGLSLHVEGRKRPARRRARLEREGDQGLVSPPQRFAVEHPDRVRRVRIRLLDRVEGLDVE